MRSAFPATQSTGERRLLGVLAAIMGLLIGAGCVDGTNAAGPTAGYSSAQAGESGKPPVRRSDITAASAGAADGAQAGRDGGPSPELASGGVGNSAGTAAGTAARAGTGASGQAGQGQAPQAGQGQASQGQAGQGQAGQGQAGQGQAGGASTHHSFQCPAGPFGEPIPADASALRVAGLPPLDAFNNDGNTITNLEGPVWIEGKLYLSEFAFMPEPSSRILALEPASGTVSVALASAGSNGLAVDMSGALIVTDHKQGAIVRMPFPLATTELLTGTFEGKRFNSPNDLAIRSDGTLYFSDPDYQASNPRPQPKTRVYRLALGTQEPTVIDDTRSQPNGVTLSADERTLYVAGADGIFSYPVSADGSIEPGSGKRIDAFNGSADGLGMDCAGNLYAAASKRIVVLSPAGNELGSIDMSQAESVTNVAFGGPERRTLFITSMGSADRRGVFTVTLNVPGFPY